VNCEILTIGSEITLGLSVDKNSCVISKELGKIGIEITRISSVPDDVELITSAIDGALNRADFLIITGGLGPTVDDLTREAIVRFTKKKLLFDPNLAGLIKKRYLSFKSSMPEVVLKQAYLPEDAIPIIPVQGTAPGLIIEAGEKAIFALPGVPREMEEMLRRGVVPYFLKRVGHDEIINIRTLKICGLSEVEIQEKIKKVLEEKKTAIAFIPHFGQVDVQIIAKGNFDHTQRILLETENEIRKQLEDYIFGVNEDNLEKIIGDILRERKLMLSVAESCTGGLLSNRITNVSGSSDYFQGGIISYNNKIKETVLGVPGEILSNYGAVSSQTAEAMASGAAHVCDADVSLAITGIAGPGGGSRDKPVGTVCIALWSKEFTYCKKLQLRGSREEIKWKASQKALEIVWQFLLKKLIGRDKC